MKIKIIGIFIGMLLIFAVFVSSGMNEEIYLQSSGHGGDYKIK